MAKKRQNRGRKQSSRQASKKIHQQVDEAMAAFYQEGDVNYARTALTNLYQKHRSHPAILLALLEIAQATHNWAEYGIYGEQLWRLESGEDQAFTLNNLIYAHNQLQEYPSLQWFYFKQLSENHPDHELAPQARDLVPKMKIELLKAGKQLLTEKPLSDNEQLALMVEHDYILLCTQHRQSQQVIDLAMPLLERYPTLHSIRNNLSLALFLVGENDAAIKAAQKVLDTDPDNFQALGNATRFFQLTGRFEEAQDTLHRLLSISPTDKTMDLFTKQVETLSFFGEDQKIIAVYQQAKKEKADSHPILLHVTAVSYLRQGDEKMAWRLWKQALKNNPTFAFAEASLEERFLPIDEQDIPWYWPLDYWLPSPVSKSMAQTVVNHPNSSGKSKRALKEVLAKRPYIPQLFPLMLELGDYNTRKFVIGFADMLDTPETGYMLYQFAQGRFGSLELRMEAISIVTQNYPALLPADKMVPMWVKGKQTSLQMLGFEITEEPEVPNRYPDSVHDKNEQIYKLLTAQKWERGEQLARELIQEVPDFPTAYNNLAMALQGQGRMDEAENLVEEMFEKFPDYLFAVTAKANMLMKEENKNPEEVQKLIQPLLLRSKLHISEFKAMAQTFVKFNLLQQQTDGAMHWLEMWESVDPDDPKLLDLQMQVMKTPTHLLNAFQDLLKKNKS